MEDLNSTSYNELLLSDEFWSNLNSSDDSNILIFQTDSGICGEGVEIEQFQRYHYCGGLFHSYSVYHGGSLVGSGGFSIRHVGTSRRLLRDNPDHRHHFYWEDVLFSHWCLKDSNCEVCPQEVARTFAATGTGLDSENPWGFHRNWHDISVDSVPDRTVCAFNELIRNLNDNRSVPTGDVSSTVIII